MMERMRLDHHLPASRARPARGRCNMTTDPQSPPGRSSYGSSDFSRTAVGKSVQSNLSERIEAIEAIAAQVEAGGNHES